MKTLHMVAFLLAMLAGITLGLVGLFKFNLIEVIFGSVAGLVTLVYILMGLSAVYLLATHMTYCKYCGTKGKKK